MRQNITKDMSINKNQSIWEEEFSNTRRIVMLMITHACNLNCSYCYESHKQGAYMTVEQAKDIIIKESKFIKNSDKYVELQVDFMGGEPLMNFSLIKEIVEWLEEGAVDVPWICFACTNATLLDEEKKKWLKAHRESFILSASYDGNTSMQSKNRGTDKYNIDLDFFHELWPEQSLQMTISKETLPHLAEGILYIQRKGYEVSASLAQGIEWTKEDALLYREQLLLLKEEYLKDKKLQPFNRLTRILDIFNLPSTERVQVQGCGSGLNMVTYDIDGNTYGCHMFTPIVLGRNALKADAVEWDSFGLMADEYCRNCILRSYCPTCPGFNYKYRGNVAKRDKRWCPMILAEAITACEFQIEKISQLDELTKLDAEYGKAALSAYKVLNPFTIEQSSSPYEVLEK